MSVKHDFDFLRDQYHTLYKNSLERGVYKLDYNLEDWHSTLSDIQLKLYNDIKDIGVFLYPLYPIGEYFVDFGNPYKKVGIEILYKEYERQERLDCVEIFRKLGWTIYTLESKYVTFSAEDLFYKLFPEERDGDRDNEKWTQFIFDYRNENSECLVYYIRSEYFSNESI